MRITFAVVIALLTIQSYAQPSVDASQRWIEKEGANILSEFVELLKIPNHASDLENINKNANLIKDRFEARGFGMRLLEEEGAPPIVYGEHLVKNATRTLCFYVHYDGQPVDPQLWVHDAFEPKMYDESMYMGGKEIPMPKPGDEISENWRIYARSASDDKAPLIALLAAVDALKESEIGYTSNIKLFFDGEEESSSPHIETYFTKYGDLLDDIDVWLMCDGSVYQSGDPSFKFGGRGITGMQLTVYGALRPLHSGHYGNWAPVPGQRLAELLASMKDEKGNVVIEGYYDSVEPLTDFEREMLNNTPNIDAQIKEELGLAWTEGNGEALNERLLLPSLTVKGLSSGSVGEKARNIIPSFAIGELGMRLVKGCDPDHMLNLVEAHIEKEGWHIVREDPDMETRKKYPKIVKVIRDPDGFPATRVNMEQPEILNVVNGVKSFTGDAVFLVSSGGSNRVNDAIYNVLKTPAISVNMVNHDNNQHAENENVRVGNLWYGVKLMSVLLTLPNDLPKK